MNAKRITVLRPKIELTEKEREALATCLASCSDEEDEERLTERTGLTRAETDALLKKLDSIKENKGQRFAARVVASPGTLLLGGVKVHESAPFESFEDAVRWADVIIETNKQAGREPMYDGVKIVK